MPKRSAGLLLHRLGPSGEREVLLAHPGGPFWAHRDDGSWSIPKGEYVAGEEEPHDAALREFVEELGSPPPPGEDVLLGERRQPGGKLVIVWAREGDYDADGIVSNEIALPLRDGSGRMMRFPEVDRAGWFTLEQARAKITVGQFPFLDDLRRALEA